MIVELLSGWRATLSDGGHEPYLRGNGLADSNPLTAMDALQYRFHVIHDCEPPPKTK